MHMDRSASLAIMHAFVITETSKLFILMVIFSFEQNTLEDDATKWGGILKLLAQRMFNTK